MASRISPKFLIAIPLLVVGLAILFSVGLKGSLVYYLTVGEFLDQRGTSDLHENFRVNGNVVEGSITRESGVLGANFLMTDGERHLEVIYARETPDTFVDGSEVVVEGALGPDGVFVANTLFAKCPSKYEAENREEDYKTDEGQAASPDHQGNGASY